MSTLGDIYRSLPKPLQSLADSILRAPELLPFTEAGRRARWYRGYREFQNTEREDIFKAIAYYCHVNRPMNGYYMEFGSHMANTMRMAQRHGRYLFDWEYIAFDSFEGFPEIDPIDEQEVWAKGKCATSEQAFRRIVEAESGPHQKLRTVKGFYDHSLTPELQRELLPKKAAIIYIDCDLYKSTVPVLNFIKPFLQRGTVVVFDDWNCFWAHPDRGMRLAWREFLEANPHLHFEEFVTKTIAKAFIYPGGAEPDPDAKIAKAD